MSVSLSKGGNVSLTKEAPGLTAAGKVLSDLNEADGVEVARYDLSEDASTETAMIVGEIHRHGAEWKFRAVGQGYQSGLGGIARDFGVNVG
jgi:stress response protein SCP2